MDNVSDEVYEDYRKRVATWEIWDFDDLTKTIKKINSNLYFKEYIRGDKINSTILLATEGGIPTLVYILQSKCKYWNERDRSINVWDRFRELLFKKYNETTLYEALRDNKFYGFND